MENSNNNSNERNKGPTEAQLRWAQFHLHRKAQKLRKKIERMYLTPTDTVLHVDLPATLGNLSLEDEEFPRRVPMIRPEISKGRKAMLIESQRAYLKRKENQNGQDTELDEDDKLSAIFDEATGSSRKRMRKRKMKRETDKERLQRFEEAVRAMMTNIASRQASAPEIETPSKIWTRPDVPTYESIDGRDFLDWKWGILKDSDQAHNSIRNTPAKPPPLMDKGASWLVHLPQSQKRGHLRPRILSPEMRARLENGDAVEGKSLVHQAFHDLVQSLQDQVTMDTFQSTAVTPSTERRPHIEGASSPEQGSIGKLHNKSLPPTMRLKKYFTPTREIEDEKKDDSLFGTNLDTDFAETENLPDTEARLSRYAQEITTLLDPNLMQYLEAVDPGNAETVVFRCLEEAGFNPLLDDNIQTVLPYVDILARKYLKGLELTDMEGTPFTKVRRKSRPSGFVHQLVEELERNQEDLVAADGRLHKAAFAELVIRYLREAGAGTPRLANKSLFHDSVLGEEKIDRAVSSRCSIDSIVENFLSRMEKAKLRMNQGKIDLQNLESLMTKHFADLSGTDESLVRESRDLESLVSLSEDYKPRATFIDRIVDFFEHSAKSGNVFDISLSKESIDTSPVSGVLNTIGSREFSEKKQKIMQNFVSVMSRHIRVLSSKLDSDDSERKHSLRKIVVQSLAESSGVPEEVVENINGFDNLTCQTYDGDVISRTFTKKMVKELQLSAEVEPIVNEIGNVDRNLLQNCISRSLNARVTEQLDFDRLSSPVALARARQNAGDSKVSDSHIAETVLHEMTFEASRGFIHSFLRSLDADSDSMIGISPDGRLDWGKFETFMNEKLETAVRDWNSFPTHGEVRTQVNPNFWVDRNPSETGQSTSNSELNAVAEFRRRVGMRDDASLSSTYSAPSHILTALKPHGRADQAAEVGVANVISEEVVASDPPVPEYPINSSETIVVPGLDPRNLSHLMLSPTMISKRLKQAMQAIETRKWDQVQYLLKANPWLAEMQDSETSQYLLHKLSLFGSSINEDCAPEDLNSSLVQLFPAAVFKFDRNGNLPLHLAAASANLSLVQLLGDRFPSGASVRNEDGMLPLHLAILACSTDISSSEICLMVVDSILGYFGLAVAVFDDEGNLPIHLASTVLKGDLGVAILRILIEEAERQERRPEGIRFRQPMPSNTMNTTEDDDDATLDTEAANPPTVLSFDQGFSLKCTDVTNLDGDVPLASAIRSRAGWKVVQELLNAPEGVTAASFVDSDGSNALHLTLGETYRDLASALVILKTVPLLCVQANDEGLLPIEVACINALPQEMILALVLADLPIKLDAAGTVEKREGRGLSWWYLACDCDDEYVNVLQEVLSLCSYIQARELCFCELESRGTLVTCSTPECREVLRKALRFVGRYEFLGKSVVHEVLGIKIFEALDFGTEVCPYLEGKKVYLRCYAREDVFIEETRLFKQVHVDFSHFEEISTFNVGKGGMATNDSDSQQYCLSIEMPSLTLSSVIKGMLKNADCHQDPSLKLKYNMKVFTVLRSIAKSLHLLHEQGVIHGNLLASRCGKFGTKWKLTNLLGIQSMGEVFTSRQKGTPPECHFDDESTISSASIDVWMFGALVFESVVGTPLHEIVEMTEEANAAQSYCDSRALHLMELSQMPDSGCSLVSRCLSVRPKDRPSIEEVLVDDFWLEVRKIRRSTESSVKI